ncbi:hypothetical protein [Streptomyces sp. NPDC002088]|uniref:hypothetical protein n=1 Tax=Streptomyces sp. NPDC002088 TaxID=3154665 RepID=UPI003329FDB6
MSDTSDPIPELVPARPWRREDGPEPKVTTYPHLGGPALAVWSHGAWRWAPVMARQDWADGRIFYQVSVNLDGTSSVTVRLYQWPQPGLRIAQPPTAHTSGDNLPAPPGRRPRPR